ncbi:MAG TPA: hypothetical protein VM890_00205 [Longimicrobium sp.]|jgi:hypothetical protein|nr:hypothetical protein [Longimicrobium sp.]
MPDYAYLETDLPCPHCGRRVTDLLWFQWGFCGGYAQRPESTYAPGEAIRWRRAPDGTVPTWTSFRAGEAPAGSNLGDPAIRDLVVRDTAQYWLLEPCPHCGGALDGGAVEIRGGVVVRGWLLRPGELPAGVEVFSLSSGGAPEPLPGADNPPMRLLDVPDAKAELVLGGPDADPATPGDDPGSG